MSFWIIYLFVFIFWTKFLYSGLCVLNILLSIQQVWFGFLVTTYKYQVMKQQVINCYLLSIYNFAVYKGI